MVKNNGQTKRDHQQDRHALLILVGGYWLSGFEPGRANLYQAVPNRSQPGKPDSALGSSHARCLSGGVQFGLG